MSKSVSQSRRAFLKTSAGGAVGLAIAGSGSIKKASAQSAMVWTDQMPVNPDIDNLRVAYIHDTEMLSSGSWSGFSGSNNPSSGNIVYDKVKENLDKMACALAQKNTAAEAWATIFRKPDAKSWSDVKVAIKVNGIGGFHPSIPISAKMCEVLMDIGVMESNILIYDAAHGCTGFMDPFKSNGELPSGIQTSNNTTRHDVDLGGYSLSATDLVDDIDILINLAVCKGHDRGTFGQMTMCQKNHFGTFTPQHESTERFFDINKSSVVLGTPGDGVPVRQQLCIVDCLWCGLDRSWAGDIGNGSDLRTLVMGTFGGAVDYLTTKKVREEYSTDYVNDVVLQFLTAYGYPASMCEDILTMDPDTDATGRGFVDAADWVPSSTRATARAGQKAATLEVVASGNGLKSSVAKISLNNSDGLKSVSVYTPGGRLVRKLAKPNSSNGKMRITWDGRNNNGRMVRSGSYIVKVEGINTKGAGTIIISK